MKKVVSLLLALVLCLSLGTVAFAEGSTDTANWKSDETTLTLKKEYSGDVFPAEKLTFTVTADESNPDATTLTVADLTVAAKESDITVNIPAYSKVGTYKYTITENAGATQGVTKYDDGAIAVAVLVTYDYDNEKLAAEVQVAKAEGADEKKDTFTNEYAEGSLDVTKSVTGNLGDKNAVFTVTVTFTTEADKTVNSTIAYTDDGEAKTVAAGWTGEKEITITLKDGETVSFANIPVGVSYTVVEAEANQDGYTTTYEGKNGTISASAATCTITNNKEATIETGVSLDSLPYILVLAGVIAVAAVLVLRKRRVND